MNGRPAAPLALLVAATLAALAALAGCAADADPPPRARPDSVELAAVQRTSDAFNAGDAPLPWVQLWTSNQFPTELKNCVAEQSHGQLGVDVQLPLLRGLTYGITGSGSQPNEAAASRIIESCAAATPLDDRVLRVPHGEWPRLYSYDLTTLKPCLVAHGFAVGAVPTRLDFDNLLQAEHPWSPYDAVTVTTRAAWYAISDACPALPASVTVAPAPTTRFPFSSN